MKEPKKDSSIAPRAQAPLFGVQGQGWAPPKRNYFSPVLPVSEFGATDVIEPETQAVTAVQQAGDALTGLALSCMWVPRQGWAEGRMTCYSGPSCQRAIVQARLVASLVGARVQNKPGVAGTMFAVGGLEVEVAGPRSIESAYVVGVANDGLQEN